jgi:hypothetical protein
MMNLNQKMFSLFENFRKLTIIPLKKGSIPNNKVSKIAITFFYSFLEWGKCMINGNVDYRYKKANVLLTGTVGDVQECASACSLNTSCVYWTYEETSQVCKLLPSGVLDMTQEIARTGKIRRGSRYCHSKFCLKPTFDRGWIMAQSEDLNKAVYYHEDRIK